MLAGILFLVLILAVAVLITVDVVRMPNEASIGQPDQHAHDGERERAGAGIHAFSREPAAREQSVPAAVARIGTGPADVDSFERPDQAARAFDQTRRDLPLPTAGDGALRDKSNATFVNLSRRSQALVERQLRLIESLEHGEQDRQRLASLSRLNRIAMRMHRNSQNLLVLAGQEPATSWNQPVTLAHLVEAALSEVEDYERVSYEIQPDIAVRGPAVHDAVHLLVELIDNATSFSAADMPVHVRGHVLTTGGALVDVTDRGIGMAANEMAYANQQLDNPPPPDIDVPKWMGLLVVARLAARHGIRVRLNQADLGGLTALVWLPDEILTHYSAAADPGHPAAAPRAAPASSPAFAPPDGPTGGPAQSGLVGSQPAGPRRAGRRAALRCRPPRRAGRGPWRGRAPGGKAGGNASAAHLRRGRVRLDPEHPRGIRSGRLGRGRRPPAGGPGDRRPGLRPLAPFRACHLARRPGRVPRAATGRPDSRAAPARAGPRLPTKGILADQTSPDAGNPPVQPGVVTRTAPFGFSRVVFLSHVIDAGTPVFPGDPPVEIRPAAVIQQDGYYLQSLTFGEQAGTHWAAPAHFHAGQPSADELDPGDFFRPAVVLDVRAAAGQDADFTLGVPEIRQWEATFGPIPPGSAVIMWTGFEDRWDDPAAYLNSDSAGELHYPGFGAEAARWLIDQRSIGVLGIDTMGIDPGADTSYAANQLLLQQHRLHLENLCGLNQMPPTRGWIIIGGLRIRAGSGSPATVFGLIP